MKETEKRTKEFMELSEKIKGIKLLISYIGPQHAVRVRRECETQKFFFGNCSQEICCNVKYLQTITKEKKIGKEYCLLQGIAKCSFQFTK